MPKLLTADDLALALLKGLGLKDQNVISLVLTVGVKRVPTMTIERYVSPDLVDIETLELAFKDVQLVPVECKAGPEAL